MQIVIENRTDRGSQSDWYRELARYEKPDLSKALAQIADTLIPYFGLWVLMVYMLKQGWDYWLIIPLLVLAAGLQMRAFIIFHDCTHGSFFHSRRANQIVGYITGVLTLTPFDEWRYTHAVHHATAGDLDRRGMGDIETMTVAEYRSAPAKKRLVYRFIRNPFVLLFVGAPILFFVLHRFPRAGAGRAEMLSVLYTDLALAAVLIVIALTIGLPTFLAIQVPVTLIAAAAGVWFFYVQHQFEGVYWARHKRWDYFQAALQGSSYYRLPGVIQWFSGNIGFHHIHHLKPRIPNYHLPQAYRDIPAVQNVKPLTLRTSLRSLFLNLWDEEQGKLVSFRDVNL